MKLKEIENLSAYLDGQLNAAERSRLKSRLEVDAGLSRVLEDLRLARQVLKHAPRRRAPRSFTLDPTNRRVRGPRPAAVPGLRYAGAMVSLAFLFTLAVNALSPLAARNLAAVPAPAYGVGGGYGGGAPEAEAPAESLAVQPEAAPALGPTPAAGKAEMPGAESLDETMPRSADSLVKAPVPVRTPLPWAWVLALGAVGVGLGGMAWYLDRRSRRDFRSKLLEK